MNDSNLPFLTRKMIVSDEQMAFKLEILTIADKTTNLEIQGMTKEAIFRYNFTTTNDSVTQSTLLQIPDIPISVSLKAYSDSNGANDVYAVVYLIINGIKNMLLCQGNLGHVYGINWPNQAQTAPLQARGKSTVYKTTDPAAGVEPSISVPAGEHWILKGISGTLRTSAAPATRRVNIIISPPEGGNLYIPTISDQVAGETINYNFGVGMMSVDNTTSLIKNQPLIDDLILKPTTHIDFKTTNWDAGDDWSIIYLFIEKYYSNI